MAMAHMQMPGPPMGLTAAPTQQEHMQLAQVGAFWRERWAEVCQFFFFFPRSLMER